jgi:flavin reductase ActVB
MISPELFRNVLGRFASGVTVITAVDGDGAPQGMTVSAFSSVSLEPPLVLVCIADDATMAPVMAQASAFGVHILGSTHEALSRRFASQAADRFTDVAHTVGALGAPQLTEALAWLQCRIVARHPAGDHMIVVGQVEAAGTEDGSPLLYFRGRYATLST